MVPIVIEFFQKNIDICDGLNILSVVYDTV